MTLTALRPADAPTLDDLARDPARVHDLAAPACVALVVQLGGLLGALGARIAGALEPAPTLGPPLDVKTAAPLLGLSPGELRRKLRADPAYRALRFDNGTDKILLDPVTVERFRRRRTGA